MQTSPSTQAPEQPGSSGTFIAMVVIVGLFILLIVPLTIWGAIVLANDDDSGGGSSGAAATSIGVSLSEFSIDGNLTAPAGEVSLVITNNGSEKHNLVVDTGARTPDFESRGVQELDLGTLSAGEYEMWCDIAGHRESGMENTLVVTAGAGDVAAAVDGGDEGGAGDGDGPDYQALDQAMMDSILAFPTATEGSGNPILEPTILDDGTKQFEITPQIVPWEKAPGEIVDAWTYNGVVPAPQIVVDVGDTVQVIVHNELPMGTDVHWHGIHTPNDQDGVAPITQDLILAGEDYTYEFVAEEPGIGMYHAHHHGQMQVINGMFGVFRIGERPYPRGQTISGVTIPEDFEPDHELPMVLNDAGVIGLTLNGKSFPATEPLVLDEGDWVAVDYYNEGLTSHPMHLHQFPQLVYAKDGIPLDQPYWADTINVAPGERYSIIMQARDPGTWVWHCHILTHAEREEGMFGMVTAIIVNPAETDPEADAALDPGTDTGTA
ncbi:MAG: multicopper oxidase domain-containing protein [Acidimicrobiia bacterium]|nr:multicopper oxidase domain-containing protein [Acidimicrobiia bacterium]